MLDWYARAQQAMSDNPIILVGVLVLMLPLMKLVLGMTMTPPSKPNGRVVGVVGLMGGGKTLYCVREMLRRLERGQNVASNFTMELPEGYADRWRRFDGWEDFALLRGVTIFLDEAHFYAPSGGKIPVEAQFALAMARKNRCDLFWIAQHQKRVSTTLRDLTGEMVECKRLVVGHRARSFDPETFERKGKARQHLWSVRYRPSKKLIAVYNTRELVLPEATVDKDGAVARILDKAEATAEASRRQEAADVGAKPTRVRAPRVRAS